MTEKSFKPDVMSYKQHLALVLTLFFRAAPDVSPRRLSIEAGNSPGWVSEFVNTGRANMDRADSVLAAVMRLTPDNRQGDELRALIDQLMPPVHEQPERGAA